MSLEKPFVNSRLVMTHSSNTKKIIRIEGDFYPLPASQKDLKLLQN